MYTTERMKTQVNFEWATKLNRLTLNVAGLWPNIHENASDRFLSNLRAMFSLFLLVFVGMIPALHSLVRTWGDMMATIDNLQFTLPLLTTIIKLVIIWWKKPDLVLVLNTIADDWSNVKSDKELHVMIKRAQSARVVTIFGYILMAVALFLLICLPFFGTSLRYRTNITDPIKVLPLQSHYFYDKNQSPYFELTYAAQALLLIMSAASYTGVDNLLGLLIFHLCGQMENLKERITNIKQFKNFNGGLAIIVNDHIRLIKYFDIVESTFTVLLLGLLLYFGTLFCLYGFLIVAVLTEGREMSMIRLIYLISVALNVCGHMCLYCVVGEILVAQCEGIYHAAYNYEWYKLNPEEARTLIIIMIRAHKTLHITAGKMFPMTLSMFCNLIKTSAGYVSVLLARQARQRKAPATVTRS
ncbi:odorant receptor 43a-like isoform X2 [Solenopsis invicta]|uniref:odorant receptor 43a-like isoform X2 n=1 Tax=Solenopsis invicta TaxID=13686 RepID=UPI00193DF55D|nr:odorant receptor 43a-like isoform X2 [Solenopsis invicta]